MLNRKLQRGDTIIEVLLATSVFSLLAVGAITVMNQSTNIAQRALETTLVRQQIDSQAEALRAVHLAYSRIDDDDATARQNSVWVKIKDRVPSAHIDTTTGCPETGNFTSAGSFAMNPYTARILETGGDDKLVSINDDDAPVYARILQGDAGLEDYGIWIEAEEKPGGSYSDFYEFRIRACWFGAGTGLTPSQLETTVRLYDIAE